MWQDRRGCIAMHTNCFKKGDNGNGYNEQVAALDNNQN